MSSTFTPREMTLLAYAFRAMETIPKINYARMAELAGMSNQNSAANAWREIRKKIDVVDETAETTTDVATPKAVKATGRKRKAKETDVDDDTEMEVTPKKKRTRKPAATNENGDVEAEKKTPGPKKGTRKPATHKGTPKADETLIAKNEADGSDPNVEELEVAAFGDQFISADDILI